MERRRAAEALGAPRGEKLAQLVRVHGLDEKRVEPGLGMGVTVQLSEDQSQQHYQDLLAKLAASR